MDPDGFSWALMVSPRIPFAPCVPFLESRGNPECSFGHAKRLKQKALNIVFVSAVNSFLDWSCYENCRRFLVEMTYRRSKKKKTCRPFTH